MGGGIRFGFINKNENHSGVTDGYPGGRSFCFNISDNQDNKNQVIKRGVDCDYLITQKEQQNKLVEQKKQEEENRINNEIKLRKAEIEEIYRSRIDVAARYSVQKDYLKSIKEYHNIKLTINSLNEELTSAYGHNHKIDLHKNELIDGIKENLAKVTDELHLKIDSLCRANKFEEALKYADEQKDEIEPCLIKAPGLYLNYGHPVSKSLYTYYDALEISKWQKAVQQTNEKLIELNKKGFDNNAKIFPIYQELYGSYSQFTNINEYLTNLCKIIDIQTVFLLAIKQDIRYRSSGNGETRHGNPFSDKKIVKTICKANTIENQYKLIIQLFYQDGCPIKIRH